jgi:4-hydroxy-tetrahydrodipicolinate synthase
MISGQDLRSMEGAADLTTTPLNQDYTLNEEALRKEVDWVIESGATSLWIRGFVGEWPSLGTEVSERLFEVAADQARGRAWVGAGCHSTNLPEVIRLVNHAEKVGCDFAWVCPMNPRRLTEDEAVAQYQYILDRTSLPLGVYNAYYVGTYMNAEVLMRIASLSDRLVTIKETVSDVCHTHTLYRVGLHKKVRLFGACFNAMEHLILGGAGFMGPTYMVRAEVALYKAFKDGDMERAWALQDQLVDEPPFVMLLIPGLAALSIGAKIPSSGIGYYKAKNSIVLGIDMGPPAPPYMPATEADIKQIKKIAEKWRHP